MIKIVYDRKKPGVVVTGHADTAPKGQDIVCAAVSQTCYIMAVAVMDMCDRKMAKDPMVSLKDGEAKIKCTPVEGSEDVVRYVADSIARGFDILAKNNKERIEMKVLDFKE